MTPKVDQSVTVVFRNGIRVEGFVVSWTDNQSVLRSGARTKVIHKTLEDILYYEIVETKTEFEKIKSKPVKNSDDINELAELKKELLQIEREELAAKMQDHTPTITKPVQYGLPEQLFKIKNPIQHPREEAPRENTGIGAGLQDLFGKKHHED